VTFASGTSCDRPLGLIAGWRILAAFLRQGWVFLSQKFFPESSRIVTGPSFTNSTCIIS
jgi:hypothetical protein